MYPILFDFGFIKVYSFGILMVVGFLLGLWLMIRLVRIKRLSTFFIFRHLLGAVVMALVGGYIGHLVLGIESHLRFNLITAIPWASGFSLYGVMFAGWLYFRLVIRDDRKLFWQYMDCLSLSVLLGLVFGYAGWFLSGKGLGPYTDIPWLAWSKLERIDLSVSGSVHPIGIYLAAACLVIFLFCLWLWRRKSPVSTVFWVAMFFYNICVAVAEQFRLVEDSLYWWKEWNLNQIVAVILVFISIVGIYRSQNEKL